MPTNASRPSACSARYETPVARITARAPSTRPPSSVTRVAVVVGAIASIAARHDDLGAQPQRLLARSRCEVVARDAAREAEVVLDAGRRAGLAAGRLALDEQRAQALRGAVDRCGEARRARRRRPRRRRCRARLDLQADLRGELRRSTGARGCARRAAARPSSPPPRRAASRRSGRVRDPLVVGIRPLEAHLVAREEVAQPVALGIVRAADHDRQLQRGSPPGPRGPRRGAGCRRRSRRAAPPTRARAAPNCAGRSARRASA